MPPERNAPNNKQTNAHRSTLSSPSFPHRWSLVRLLASDPEAGTIDLADEPIGLGGVGGLHGRTVPLDRFLQTDRQISHQEGLGERARVVEPGLGVGGLPLLAGQDPLGPMADRAGNGLRRAARSPSSCSRAPGGAHPTSRRRAWSPVADEIDAVVGQNCGPVQVPRAAAVACRRRTRRCSRPGGCPGRQTRR